MQFNQLLFVLRHMKKTLPCQECHKSFSNHDIEVIDLFDQECLFHLMCSECGSSTEAHVNIVDGVSNPDITISSHVPVTVDDIHNISKTLSAHKGGFKTLFASGKKKSPRKSK